jgi:hypothetical protein
MHKIAVAMALLLLPGCAEPPPPARAPLSGTGAWLVAAQDFKTAGVASRCRLPRLAEGGAAPDDAEAERLYGCMRAAMAAAFSEALADYQHWPRFSTRPYLSAVHAGRFVNNYANAIAAAAYGRYGAGEPLPVGSVVVKDSFSVSTDGHVAFGPAFVMEKVAAERWTYTMVMPEGWVFGSSDGPGAENVAFCNACHDAVAGSGDPLYYLPAQYRR